MPSIGSVLRPDPPDLLPQRIAVLYTSQGFNFEAGYWTLKYGSTGDVPQSAFDQLATYCKGVVGSNVTFYSGAYRQKLYPTLIPVALTAAQNGTSGYFDGAPSLALAYRQSGLGFTTSGAYRSARSYIQLFVGKYPSSDTVAQQYDVGFNPQFQALRTYLAAQQMCDEFGRTLNLYSYVTTQVNSYYQNRPSGGV